MTLPNTLGAEYVRIVLSRWRLVLALVLSALAVAFGVTVFLAQNPKFEAASRLNIVPTSEELGYATRFVRGSTFDGGSTLLQTYAEFAHTRPVVAPIVDRWIAEQAQAAHQSPDQWIAANTQPPGFSPRRIYTLLNYGAAPPAPLRDDIVDGLIEHTMIETVEGTYLLKITVDWDDPQAAAWFANALAGAIIARAETMSSKSNTEIAVNLASRLAEKQAELDAVLRRSRDTKQSVGVVDVDQQKQSLLAAQIAEQSQLTSDRATLQANQSQVAGLRRQSAGKLSTAQAAIDQTIAVEGPRAAGLAQGVAIREGRIAQLRGQIAALGKHEDSIKSLDDRAQQLRTEVAALTERVSFSQTENLANAPRIQLIERAVPPLTRSSPKMLLNLALGLVAGCALAAMALLILGEAPGRVAQEAEAEDSATLEPAARERVAASDPSTSSVPPPGDAPHPRRRWSDVFPVPANVVDISRPAPVAQPAFATSGSLALARDLGEPEESVGPVIGSPASAPISEFIADPPSARAELVEALPLSSSAGTEEGQHFDKLSANGGEGAPPTQTSTPVDAELVEALPFSPRTGNEEGQHFDKPGANGEGVRTAPISVHAEPAEAAPSPFASGPGPTDPVFGYLLPPPRSGRRYDAREVRGIGAQIAAWLGDPLDSDAPLTVAATGDATGAQRLYQLLHDYLSAHDRAVVTVDWSEGARALPRGGKPLIYAGGGFGESAILAHRDGAVVVAVAADEAEALDAEARRLAGGAARPVHVVPLGD